MSKGLTTPSSQIWLYRKNPRKVYCVIYVPEMLYLSRINSMAVGSIKLLTVLNQFRYWNQWATCTYGSICGDIVVILWVNWCYLWRWEPCTFFSDSNKISKVSISFQQQMLVLLCILMKSYCFKEKKIWDNTVRHNSQEDERMRDHKYSQNT